VSDSSFWDPVRVFQVLVRIFRSSSGSGSSFSGTEPGFRGSNSLEFAGAVSRGTGGRLGRPALQGCALSFLGSGSRCRGTNAEAKGRGAHGRVGRPGRF
jgi:hypothetical protein